MFIYYVVVFHTWTIYLSIVSGFIFKSNPNSFFPKLNLQGEFYTLDVQAKEENAELEKNLRYTIKTFNKEVHTLSFTYISYLNSKN